MNTHDQARRKGVAAREFTGHYVASGVLLVLFGAVLVGWVIYGFTIRTTSAGEFIGGLVGAERVDLQLLSPYEWAFAIALIVVGVLALCLRKVARGAALLLMWMLLALSLREVVGLFMPGYLHAYRTEFAGGWVLAARAFGLVVSVVVLLLMLRAKEPEQDVPGRIVPRGQVVAGSLLVVYGLAELGWILYLRARLHSSFDGYLRYLVDASVDGPTQVGTDGDWYRAALVVALLVVGALVIKGVSAGAGAGLTLAALQLYLTIRAIVEISVQGAWVLMFEHTLSTLYLLTACLGVLCSGGALFLLWTRDRLVRPGRF
ncbi:hypothetical protein [Prauserella marina]|nr:hypothetical protein [Prauserella marina]